MKLFFREFGAGRPVLILHGLFGQSDNWNSLAKALALKQLHVFTADLRNHGLSPHSEDWSYALMADDIHELINDQEMVDPVIIGHSMGAKAQMFFELKFPGIVKDHVIVDMASRAYSPHHQLVIDALSAVNLGEIKTRKDAESVMEKYIPDFGTRQFLLKNLYHAGDGFNWRFNLDVIRKKYEAITIGVPNFTSTASALIVRGEKSDYVSEADISEFRNRFSKVEVRTIAGAGHWVHADKPAEFLAVVSAFIGV
jgi:esterase